MYPSHIAIIMDGNGRWAKSRRLPRIFGHRQGAKSVTRIVQAAREIGIRYLTLYAFSWENWNRPQDEIHQLMYLLVEFLKREEARLHRNEIRFRVIGRLDRIPESPRRELERVMQNTLHYDKMTLILALSYGGRQEIIDAARRLAQDVHQGKLDVEQIDEQHFIQALYASDVPDPDLVIRTSGEQRLSNFLLWQTSYSELYITQKLWPEFSKQDLLDAIAAYESRERRFGKSP